MSAVSEAHADLSESALAKHCDELPGSEPLISVIIPTLDEQNNLGRLLASIRAQQGVSCEAIVVDQSSTDHTVAIARTYGCEVIVTRRPRYYSPPGRNRNLGAAVAK